MTLDKWYQPAMNFARVTFWRFGIVIAAAIFAPIVLLGALWAGAEMYALLTVTDSTRRILDDQAYLITWIEHSGSPVDCIYFSSQSINDPMESINASNVGLLTYDGKRKIVLSSFGKGERDCPTNSFAVVLDDPK